MNHLLVVDGHHLVRQAIACLLERYENIESVEHAASGEEALRKARVRAPDLVVMDLALEGILHGLDLIDSLRRELPETKVIVLTNDDRRSMVDGALQAGAVGYVSKRSNDEDLATAISSVLAGRNYIAREVAGSAQPEDGREKLGDALRALSRRERESLVLIARGGTTKSIASELGISPKTVEKHRAKLARKLGIHSVAELTRFALQNEVL